MKILLPGLLLLLVPLLFILYRYFRSDKNLFRIRTALLILLVITAAGLCIKGHENGSDLVIIADRSLSISQAAAHRQQEIIEALSDRRKSGDRLGVVAFGRNASLVCKPKESGIPSLQNINIDSEASDLAKGIRLALRSIPPHRSGRLLILSDGLFTGDSPIPAAFEALERNIPIDFRALSREKNPDVAIEDILLPEEVPLGSPFQIKVSLFSEKTTNCKLSLSRGNSQIAEKTVFLEKGLNQVFFRDLPRTAGILKYHAYAEVKNDPQDNNNFASGAVEVKTQKKVLLVNQEGKAGNLANALLSAKIPLEIRGPADFPAILSEFVPYRVIIIEDVAATSLPGGSLFKTSLFIRELGGGVLLTGGLASFGKGGYYLSKLDPLLPVSMELKQEHRKLSIAMVIALDRSGSMAMRTADGSIKMDLANTGTCAAIDLLGPGDQVAVVAVDSAAHLIVDLTEVNNKREIGSRVLSIKSMGGGIMTDKALAAAASILAQTDRTTRHLVLFADAADAEESGPGNCSKLVKDLVKLGVTVSVIGLGSSTDSDAGLLKMIANKTGGRIYFSNRAKELPQIFAMETITVSRSGFIRDRTSTGMLSDINLLGDFYNLKPPVINGYNLTYLKPGANCGLITKDEYKAPAFAFWSKGLGRIAALTTPADGDMAKGFLSWSHYGDFLVSITRYLYGDNLQGIFVSVKRKGNQAIVTAEVDPEDEANLDRLNGAEIITLEENGANRKTKLTPKKAGVFNAQFPLERSGIYFGSLKTSDGKSISVAPISLPYSPEYALQRNPEAGKEILEKLADISGGKNRIAWKGAYTGRGGFEKFLPVIFPFLAALLILHLVEIAFRRLGIIPAALLSFIRTGPLRTVNPLRLMRRLPKGKKRARQQIKKTTSGKQAHSESAASSPESSAFALSAGASVPESSASANASAASAGTSAAETGGKTDASADHSIAETAASAAPSIAETGAETGAETDASAAHSIAETDGSAKEQKEDPFKAFRKARAQANKKLRHRKQ